MRFNRTHVNLGLLVILAAAPVVIAIAILSRRARPYAGVVAIAAMAYAALYFGSPSNDSGLNRLQLSVVRQVTLTFTSDPPGAEITVNGVSKGFTPISFDSPAGVRVNYRVNANEPFPDYDLYLPFSGNMTPDADTAIDVWLERTTAEQQAEERQRRAEAVERNRQSALQRELNSSNWKLYRSQDPITDEDRSYVVTRATEYPTVLQRDARLVIRCDRNDPTSGDGIAMYIDADEYLGNRDLPIDWRFDENPPVQKQTWRPSTDGTALFNMSYKTAFLRQMLDAATLSARLYDYRDVSYYYEFDVRGSGVALTLLGCYSGSAL